MYDVYSMYMFIGKWLIVNNHTENWISNTGDITDAFIVLLIFFSYVVAEILVKDSII